MSKHLLGYNYMFIVEDEEDAKGCIGSVGVDVLIRLFKRDGTEIAFKDGETALYLDGIENYFGQRYCFLSDFLQCSFDREAERYVTFYPLYDVLNHIGYRISWEITGYCKDISDGHSVYQSESIDEEEFKEIIEHRIDQLDTATNKPAQVPSYFTKDISYLFI